MPSPSSIRLPITDPDYKYPASKNPYWQKNKDLAGLVFSDNETETHRGHWLEQFRAAPAPKSELRVEIGCNAGHVVVEWAARDPQNRYVGLDWKFKTIFRAAEKVNKRDLKNLVFFRAHAERLKYMFGESEVDSLALYFPDPWPKKAHWKNRFVTAERLRDIHHILKPGGIFHIKTDHRGYFDWMEERIAETRDLWTVLDRSTDLHANHPNPLKLDIPEVTLFERLFIRDGIQINSIHLKTTKT